MAIIGMGRVGIRSIAAPSNYTTRTTAFATATGISDTTILNALNTFDTGLISNGLDTKMKALYPFVGGTAATHKFNFMDARDLDAAFRLTFNGGWTHSVTGALPNGTNAYGNTFLNISTQTSLFNIHYSIYCRNNTSQGIDIGVTNSNSGYKDEGWMASRYNGFAQGGFYDNDAGISGGGIKVSNSDSTGMYISSAIAMNNQFLRKNNTTLGTWTGLDVTSLPANTTAYIGAVHRENDNLAIEFSNKQYAIATIGSGLNITEASTFYNLVQAFQTSLSRQV